MWVGRSQASASTPASAHVASEGRLEGPPHTQRGLIVLGAASHGRGSRRQVHTEEPRTRAPPALLTCSSYSVPAADRPSWLLILGGARRRPWKRFTRYIVDEPRPQ